MNKLVYNLIVGASLALIPTIASAKMVSGGSIAVDVPSEFVASEIDRGLETKTPDDEIFVWFETYKGNDGDIVATATWSG